MEDKMQNKFISDLTKPIAMNYLWAVTNPKRVKIKITHQ